MFEYVGCIWSFWSRRRFRVYRSSVYPLIIVGASFVGGFGDYGAVGVSTYGYGRCIAENFLTTDLDRSAFYVRRAVVPCSSEYAMNKLLKVGGTLPLVNTIPKPGRFIFSKVKVLPQECW